MTPYILGAIASLNVLLGGYLVLRFKKYFNIMLGFAGGVMISVVAFEVLPELFEIVENNGISVIAASLSMVMGILLFHVISFFFPLHEHGHHDGHDHAAHDHSHHEKPGSRLGSYAAVIMIIHSVIDGFGIGLGFNVSAALGIAVAIAVITHNFSDGINTVSTLINAKASNTKVRFLLTLNVLAPLLGVLLSQIFSLPEYFVAVYLAFFSGSILYLAISDILPQAHSDKSEKTPILATVLGVVFVLIITLLSGHH